MKSTKIKIKKSAGKLQSVEGVNGHPQDAYVHEVDPKGELAVLFAKNVERMNRGKEIEQEIDRLMTQRKLLVSEIMTDKIRQGALVDDMFDYEDSDECSKMIADPKDETQLVREAVEDILDL